MEFEAYRAMLKEQDWRVLSKQLTELAFKHGRGFWARWTRQDAEDAAQEVICDLFDPATLPRWDPARQPSLYVFLYKPLTRIINTRGRRAARHAYRESQVAAEIEIAAADQADARERKRVAARKIELMRVDRMDDPDALRVIGCLEEGVDDIKETADRLGIPENRVRNARWRIGEALTRVKRLVDEEEEARRG